MVKKVKLLYRTEEDVKKALEIESFRNLSKEKLLKFMELIPNMDKEIVLSSIKQFLKFANLAGDIVKQVKDLSETAIKENSKSQNEVLNAYIKVIEAYSEEIKSDKISPKRKKELLDKLEAVADKMSAKDAENKSWIKSVITTTTSIAAAVIVLTAAIFNIKISPKN